MRTISLYRKGDFYEAYSDDARKMAKMFGDPLVKIGDIVYTGFPYTALDTYLKRLFDKGIETILIKQRRHTRLNILNKRNGSQNNL